MVGRSWRAPCDPPKPRLRARRCAGAGRHYMPWGSTRPCRKPRPPCRTARLLAYLDDLYILTSEDGARPAIDTATRCVQARAGVAANLGKTRAYSPSSSGIAELGDDVWRGERPPEETGFLALGTPIGSTVYIAAQTAARARHLPDLQTAWLLLSFCASPRAQHLWCMLPPAQPAVYAVRNDDAIWATLLTAGRGGCRWTAASVGGSQTVGLSSRLVAVWADVLAPLARKYPDLACRFAREWAAGDEAAALRLQAAAAAGESLDAAGMQGRPHWAELLEGQRASMQSKPREPADGPQDAPCSESRLDRTRPHGLPPGTTLPPQHMQIALRRRLRLPRALTDARSGGHGSHGCDRNIDVHGDHRAACPRTGALARRAHVVEHAWVRVSREAVGAEGRVIPPNGWCTPTREG